MEDKPQCTFRIRYNPYSDEKSPTPSPPQSPSDAPPIRRYKKKNRLSVTDFSAQMWCEQQLEYALMTGYRKETAAMKAGTARHEILEEADHEVQNASVHTREDNLGLRLHNTVVAFEHLMPLNGKVREVWVCLNYQSDCVIRGVIDELGIVVNPKTGRAETVIRDTKTRREEKEPGLAQKRTSAMQLQTYHYMIDSIREDRLQWKSVLKAFKCRGSKPFESPVLSQYGNLNVLGRSFVQAVKKLPRLAPYCEVEYDCNGVVFLRDRVAYTADVAEYQLAGVMKWWLGGRPAEAALQNEKWKCKMCPFLERCDVSPIDDEGRRQELQRRDEEQLSQDLEELACTQLD